MTVTNVTPTESTNAPTDTTATPIDNMGNPVDSAGNPTEVPKEPVQEASGTLEEQLEAKDKALKDTKAELTRLQQGKTKEPAKETDLEIKPKEATADDAAESVVNFDKYSEEFNKDDALSEESYAELEKQGFPKSLVDDYIAGQQARVQRQTAEVAAVVGGEENLTPILEWAGQNLPPEAIELHNEAITKGSEAAKISLEGIYARYQAAEGKNPQLLNGDSNGGSADFFKSSYEMTKAMEDKRYWKDPDYQQEVAQKVANSHARGIY